MPFTPTPEQEKDIRRWFREGLRGKAIGRRLGLKEGAGYALLARLGLHKGKASAVSASKAHQVMALRAEGMTENEVAEKMGISPRAVSLAQNQIRRLEPIQQNHHAMRKDREHIRVFYKPGRYALCGDFHVPFHDEKALEQLLSVKGDFDGCIVAGDLLDCYAESRFMKDMKLTMEREIAEANGILDRLAERFGRVLMFQGNHEERVWKNLRHAAEAMILKGGDQWSEEVYASAKKLLDLHNGKLNAAVHTGWWVQIGRCVFAHGDKYVQTKGKAVEGLYEHLMGRMEDYGIKEAPSLITQHHTHRLAGPARWMTTWQWEQPAMCGMLDYQTGSKAHKGHTDTGFSVVTMRKDGTFWFNESRTVLVER